MFTEVNDVPATDFGSLAANIGGQLGLFLGMSLMSALEIVEYAYEIFIYLKNRKSTQN